jgi:anti-sigma factor RsiW
LLQIRPRINEACAPMRCPFCNADDVITAYSGPLSADERARQRAEDQKTTELKNRARRVEIEQERKRDELRKLREEEEDLAIAIRMSLERTPSPPYPPLSPSSYSQSQSQRVPMRPSYATVFVGNLSFGTTEEQLAKFFRLAGPV